MSILSSLFTGVSGIQAHGDGVSVVGDNLANMSTVGYKSSRAHFSDVLGGTLGGQRLGAGVRMGAPDSRFTQGTLQNTGGGLDFAVRGEGFFVVNGSQNGLDGSYYTRDGRFHLDSGGVLVNPGGLRVQGYTIDGNGATSTEVTDLALGQGQSAPKPTATANLSVNLDSGAIPPAAFDPADPGATSNFSTSMTVYDSLGQEHRADVYFRTNGGGSWEWHAMVDGGEITGGTAGTPSEIASGTLGYTANGALDTETTTASSADFVGATAGQVIAFDFGDSITTDAGTGLAGSTQFAGPSTVSAANQDGFGAGSLVDVNVGDDGTITGSFSNGQRREIARVALATFATDSGLERTGSQLYSVTRDSGEALVGAAATGGRGAISAGNLEASNVDVGTELVNLIAYQRALQANARVVSTADEIYAELANLKR